MEKFITTVEEYEAISPDHITGELDDFVHYVLRGEGGLIEDVMEDLSVYDVREWLNGLDVETLEGLAGDFEYVPEDDGEDEEDYRRFLVELCEFSDDAKRALVNDQIENGEHRNDAATCFDQSTGIRVCGRNEWFIHTTDADPAKILRTGWRGVDPLTCGGTRLEHIPHSEGELGFAYTFETFNKYSELVHNLGNNYILLKAPAVEAYHDGDDDLQILFDVTSLDVAIPLEEDVLYLKSLLGIVNKKDRKALTNAFKEIAEELGFDPDDEAIPMETLEVGIGHRKSLLDPESTVKTVEEIFNRAGLGDYLHVEEEEDEEGDSGVGGSGFFRKNPTNVDTKEIVRQLEKAWPLKFGLKEVLLKYPREEGHAALVEVLRKHGVDEDDIRGVVASVLRSSR